MEQAFQLTQDDWDMLGYLALLCAGMVVGALTALRGVYLSLTRIQREHGTANMLVRHLNVENQELRKEYRRLKRELREMSQPEPPVVTDAEFIDAEFEVITVGDRGSLAWRKES